MDFPKEFDDRHWWIPVAIAGALIAAASAPAKFVAGVIIGLGLLVFGVGQWIDHPIQTGFVGNYQVTSYRWRPTFFGLLATFVGFVLFCFGLYRLLAS